METDKKTIIVTGGAGFIGSHLCERLVKDGHRVISLDNYFMGSRENHVDGAEYREGHTEDIEKLILETPDIIYHLGEYSRVEQSFDDTKKVWDLNKKGTFAVLEFWKKKKCKLVYAGSSTKFGDGGLGRDQSPYAWAKATNTELVRNYSEWFDLKYAITYFYNVYGSRERSDSYGTLIAIFKEQYKKGFPLTVVSPGTQKRNFTHVSDIVDGIILAGEKGEGDDFGIGNDISYSILEVAKFFGVEPVMLPERQGNRGSSSVDTSRLQALGWSAKVNLEEHIRDFVSSEERDEEKEKRILVFSTTFYPISGPAEEALYKLIESLPNIQFDIVTTLYSKKAKDVKLDIPNVTIHRVGYGNPFDKYLLPILGSKKAKELLKDHSYIFGWSLLASYGALAAVLIKKSANIPLLITLADQEFYKTPFYIKPFLKLSLGGADQIHFSNPEQEKRVISVSKKARFKKSIGSEDAFASRIRFAYTDFLNKQ